MRFILRLFITAGKLMNQNKYLNFTSSGIVNYFQSWLIVLFIGLNSIAFSQVGKPPQFKDVAEEVGIVFRQNFGDDKLKNILHTTGSSCALFDYDNDGWLDAFLVNCTNLDKNGLPSAEGATYHALYHNEGDGTFKDVTKEAGFTEATYGHACCVGDYDGDGYLDMYITNYGPNQLFRNRGDGTFEDVSKISGTDDPLYSTGAVFF